MLSKKEFAQITAEEMTKDYGKDGFAFEQKQIDKPNRSYLSLSIIKEGFNVSPLLNLEPFYEDYENGQRLANVIEDVGSQTGRIIEITGYGKMDVSCVTNWDLVKGRLISQAIGRIGKEEFLSTVPHRVIEDMAVIYRVMLDENPETQSSFIVTNALLERYGVKEEDLLAAARENYPLRISNLYGILMRMCDNLDLEDTGDLYLLGNGKPYFGSGVIAYPEFISMAKSVFKKGFYMMPSSIHEVLITSASGKSQQDIVDMVRSINASHVSEDERLTDNAYYVDKSASGIRAIDDSFKSKKSV